VKLDFLKRFFTVAFRFAAQFFVKSQYSDPSNHRITSIVGALIKLLRDERQSIFLHEYFETATFILKPILSKVDTRIFHKKYKTAQQKTSLTLWLKKAD